MVKIAICGANGKMGHAVASCIEGRNDCAVVAGIDAYTDRFGGFPIV